MLCDPITGIQREEQPHIEKQDFQPREPIRDWPAASAQPCRLSKDGPAKITGKPLQHGNYRVKARQEVKTVVSQPHAETKRNQRIRKASGHLQP